jgi:chromosome segregation ATPase
MDNTAELVRLEEFVDKLLGRYNQLKAEHQNLQQTLQDRDQEIIDLKEEISGLNSKVSDLSEQRSEVGSRVAGLLDRIEQWESEQSPSASDPMDELPGGVQSALFEGNSGQ